MTSSPHGATLPRNNRSLLALLFSTLAFRIFCIFWYRTDSDEPQHLHVVWGWARGLVQYRDVFDNHPPLFHLLSIPLLSLSPESADILIRARFFILPFALVTLLLTWLIARRVFSPVIALASVMLLGVTPPFLLKTVEFRNDVPWCALLMAALFILISGRFTVMRSVTAGLILGVALAMSLKTAILIIALVLTAITLRSIDRDEQSGTLGTQLLAVAFGGLAFAVAPLLVALFFGWLGAINDLAYGAWGFNSLFRVSNVRRIGGLIALPLLAGALLLSARSRFRRSDTAPDKSTFLALTCVYYLIALLCLWPIITTRDFLAILPIVVILFSARAVTALDKRSFRRAPWLAALVLAGMIWTFSYGDLWKRPPDYPQRLIADVLKLTDSADYVMDIKGESVYRLRPTRYIFEHVGRELVKRGILPDTVAADIVAKRCCVVVQDQKAFSTKARAFMNDNYIPAGSVRVCGKTLQSLDDGQEVEFTIAVPERYAMIARGPVTGVLDGTSYIGPRLLAPGTHRFVAHSPAKGLSVVWARAVERKMIP
ncbi:MAG TPA: glycosyltransferase family 39 protein [Thermoanaerobaculia bacterium]|nr:glycosyltransferase family 39 protein [Thermoanaerobaculia bacterium]